VTFEDGSVSSDLFVQDSRFFGVFSSLHLGTEDGLKRDAHLREDFLLIHQLGSQIHRGQILGVRLEAFINGVGVFGEFSGTSGSGFL